MSAPPAPDDPSTAPATSPRLTWSNALTSLRLLASIPLYWAIVSGVPVVAFAIFWAACASDFFDGRIARARGEVTAFGGLLDHASDATFVTTGLAALAMRGVATCILPVVVVLAFLQYAFDSRALAGSPLRASSLGRWNGILYFVPVGTLVTRDFLGLAWPADIWLRGLVWALVVSTGLSMMDRAWALLRRDRSSQPA